MNASKCTNDDENNEIMKREKGWNLLSQCSMASEAPQVAASMHGVFDNVFFTSFFKIKGEKWSSRVAHLQLEWP